ncbi:conserved hypothetical protein [Rubrivivax sp. A210]|uniref:DUF4870 family protein n=1 Tax=Rubrivivax sp. A210 TaxID=2772301 RepID=UPI0019A148ED|nr:hypothetical protein [Rubrivivax sp. A210]CAD5372557.1 conserved hypothetical protein [Rubrivivax sp. A210]
MSQVIVPGSEAARLSDLRLLTHVLYALHALSAFSGGTFAVVAIIVNYVKRGSLPDDHYRSHYRWQARSFWFTLFWLALTSPLFLVFIIPGAIAWGLVWLWYLYRFIRGWLAFHEGRSMPMPNP